MVYSSAIEELQFLRCNDDERVRFFSLTHFSFDEWMSWIYLIRRLKTRCWRLKVVKICDFSGWIFHGSWCWFLNHDIWGPKLKLDRFIYFLRGVPKGCLCLSWCLFKEIRRQRYFICFLCWEKDVWKGSGWQGGRLCKHTSSQCFCDFQIQIE